jgi:hypothetical protein
MPLGGVIDAESVIEQVDQAAVGQRRPEIAAVLSVKVNR